MSRFRRALQAWHGSPYDYDEFKDEAIGSGEGAQVYGRGHYVAEARPVAEQYRDALTKSKPKGGWYFKGVPVEQSDAMRGAHDLADPAYAKPSGLKKFHQDIIRTAEHWRDRFETYNRLKDQGLQGHEVSEDLVNSWNEKEKWMNENIQHFKFVKDPEMPGRLYEVHVALGDDEILDWDHPVSEHHPEAQKKLTKVYAEVQNNRPIRKDRYGDPIPRGSAEIDLTRSGQVIHDTLSRGLSSDGWGTNPAAATKALLDAGIRGIRYRDAGSRRPSADVYLDGEKVEPFDGNKPHHEHRAALDPDWDAASHLAIWAANNVGNTADLDLLMHRLSGIRHKDAVNTLAWLRQNKHRVQLKPSRGTYNYVVFDPKDIRIVRKYGLKNELIKDFGTEPVHLTNVEGDHQHG